MVGVIFYTAICLGIMRVLQLYIVMKSTLIMMYSKQVFSHDIAAWIPIRCEHC